MSIRVNLLPREELERERRRRALVGLGVAGGALVVVLVGLYLLQAGRVDRAEEQLRAAEERRGQVQMQVRALDQYADLERRRDEAVEVVKATMAADVTFAGVLQDLAAVMPNEAAMTALTVTMAAAEGEGDPAAEGFAFGPSSGTISGTGETLRQHAPGVERFLLEFDKIAAFFNVFLNDSTLDEEGITVFTFEANLGPEVFTGRYADGLPEELR
ncbi:MAG TPA: hypothetical protein VHF25_05795 [Nitriliruptorales bacterium]|nr:hypothetical protein [Nitriliruptorales bacterium]